jgi:hypothetical protein
MAAPILCDRRRIIYLTCHIALQLVCGTRGFSLLAPGEATFDVTETGKYTLWSRVEASFEGKLMTFPTGLPPGVTIKITKTAGGAIVPLQSKWPTMHRDSGGYIQVAIATVTFDAPGSYRITTEGLEEKRALYLDRFDFAAFLGKAAFACTGPLLLMVGLFWGILLFVRQRERPNQAMQRTADRPYA